MCHGASFCSNCRIHQFLNPAPPVPPPVPPPVLPPVLLHVLPCTADQELDQNLALIKDASLRDTLQFGIGLHHAGLAESDREVVEALYVGGKIQVS